MRHSGIQTEIKNEKQEKKKKKTQLLNEMFQLIFTFRKYKNMKMAIWHVTIHFVVEGNKYTTSLR